MNENMKIVVVANQKGGVGKSKTANTVARDLAYKDNKVLLIDFDPQMTLTKQFGINPLDIINTSCDSSTVFTDKIIEPKKLAINKDENIFLDMLFSSLSLLEYSQSGMSARELKLRKYLKKIKKLNHYDYVVIDTPGTLGVLFTNAVLCADIIITPITTTSDATDATEPFFRELLTLEEQFEHAIKDIIIFANMYNKTTNHDKEQLEIITKDIPQYIKSQKEIGNYEELTLHVVKEVPQRTVIKDAMSSGMYLREYIKIYANNKSNKEMLETYNGIYKIITNKKFSKKTLKA